MQTLEAKIADADAQQKEYLKKQKERAKAARLKKKKGDDASESGDASGQPEPEPEPVQPPVTVVRILSLCTALPSATDGATPYCAVDTSGGSGIPKEPKDSGLLLRCGEVH